jgi:hypothetical protein
VTNRAGLSLTMLWTANSRTGELMLAQSGPEGDERRHIPEAKQLGITDERKPSVVLSDQSNLIEPVLWTGFELSSTRTLPEPGL